VKLLLWPLLHLIFSPKLFILQREKLKKDEKSLKKNCPLAPSNVKFSSKTLTELGMGLGEQQVPHLGMC
jgi:hypothetical protein